MIHVFLLNEGSITDQLINPDFHHILQRPLILLLFVLFGVILQIQVNKRTRIEDALKRSEKEKSMILDAANWFIAYIDNDDNIIWANKTAISYSSEKYGNIIGKKCYTVWRQMSEPCPGCPVRNVRITGEVEEDEMILPNGRILSIHTKAVKNEKGEIIGAIKFGSDITTRKKAEEKVKELNKILRLLNKTLRHDILNDLTVIGNSIELFEEMDNKEVLNYAFNTIDKSVKLIKEMRELESLIYSGKRSVKPCDVREVIESVLKSYPVECNIEGDSTVLADEALSSVFDNIIRNAIDHGKADKIDIKIKNTNDMCEVRIADNGIGIPDDIKVRIFDEEFSGGGGTGLGLYIVQKTVERYNGGIRVEDNHPHGAVFILNLPSVKREKIESQ
jgi:sensor histidine kinase regulating citrate/malate metabolism